MKPKHSALIIALILAVVVTLLFVLLPASANLTLAYVFCLLGIVLMESGFLLATTKNVPASYALIRKTGKFLPLSLIVSLIVLVLERMGIFVLPVLWHAVVQIILLAVTSIGMVKVFAGAAYVEQIAEKVEVKTSAWRDLVTQANVLAVGQQDSEAKQAIKKVAEAIRYADPMSTSASAPFENRIAEMIDHIQTADVETCKSICTDLLLLIQERNAIVKSSK